jgi:hypothetical protein
MIGDTRNKQFHYSTADYFNENLSEELVSYVSFRAFYPAESPLCGCLPSPCSGQPPGVRYSRKQAASNRQAAIESGKL